MKYINQEAAIENAIAQMRISKSEKCMRERLLNLETVEAREIKRGKWVDFDDDYGVYDCSECGQRAPNDIEWNYCPNCGADMREEKHYDY